MTPKTLVVPLDESEYAERALPVAEALAMRLGGGLVLVSAQYRGPLHPREYLGEVANRYPLLPVEVIATKERCAEDEIIDVVAGDVNRIVCMTSHGRGGLRRAVVGSVAEDVMRHADRPVLLVGPHCRPDFLAKATHLLAGVDGSDESPELASAAKEWATLLGLEIRASMVIHPLDVATAEKADAVLAPIVEQFGGRDHVEATLTQGTYVPDTLADLAADIPAALIAMNSHARHGLARFALGSLTMSVLHKAPCPLLVTHRTSPEPTDRAPQSE